MASYGIEHAACRARRARQHRPGAPSAGTGADCSTAKRVEPQASTGRRVCQSVTFWKACAARRARPRTDAARQGAERQPVLSIPLGSVIVGLPENQWGRKRNMSTSTLGRAPARPTRRGWGRVVMVGMTAYRPTRSCGRARRCRPVDHAPRQAAAPSCRGQDRGRRRDHIPTGVMGRYRDAPSRAGRDDIHPRLTFRAMAAARFHQCGHQAPQTRSRRISAATTWIDAVARVSAIYTHAQPANGEIERGEIVRYRRAERCRIVDILAGNGAEQGNGIGGRAAHGANMIERACQCKNTMAADASAGRLDTGEVAGGAGKANGPAGIAAERAIGQRGADGRAGSGRSADQ